jgi:hypothetical protein
LRDPLAVELDKRERRDLLVRRVQQRQRPPELQASVLGLAWGIAPKPKQRRLTEPSIKRPSTLFEAANYTSELA